MEPKRLDDAPAKQGYRERIMEQTECYQLLETLMQRLHTGLIVFQHHKVRFANDRMAQMLGYQSAIDLLGRPYHSLFREELRPGQNSAVLALGISNQGMTLPLTVDLATVSLPTGPCIIMMTNAGLNNSNYEQLLMRANYDELTGLPNRNLFNDRFKHALAKAERYKSCLALMFIDLVQFKGVNDTLGHAAGDTLLKKLAVRLTGAIRFSDTVARLAGDEFVVLLEEVHDPRMVEAVAVKIMQAISQPMKVRRQQVQVGASIGIALYPQDGALPETLIHHADQAMYAAKANGGSSVKFYSGGDSGTSLAAG